MVDAADDPPTTRRTVYVAASMAIIVSLLAAGGWYLWGRAEPAVPNVGDKVAPTSSSPAASEALAPVPGRTLVQQPGLTAKMQVSGGRAVFSLVAPRGVHVSLDVDRDADGVITAPPARDGQWGTGPDVSFGATQEHHPCVQYLIDLASSTPCTALGDQVTMEEREAGADTVRTWRIPLEILVAIAPDPRVAFNTYDEKTGSRARVPESGFLVMPSDTWPAELIAAARASLRQSTPGVAPPAAASPAESPARPDLTGYLSRAQSHFEARRYAAALDEAERALQIDPDNNEAKRLAARIRETMDILGVRR